MSDSSDLDIELQALLAELLDGSLDQDSRRRLQRTITQ